MHNGNGAYYAVATIIGILAGTIGSIFHLTVDAIMTTWPRLLREDYGLEGPSLYIAAALVAAVMATAGLWLVRRFAPESSGSGVQEIEGAMEGLREVRWQRVLPVKFFGGLLSLGSGMVLGREGPTIHMGASIAKAASDMMSWRDKDMHGLLAAGGAAGLGAAFNAPLAAVLFVIEETRRQFPYSARTYIAVVLACVASGVVTTLMTGSTPYMMLSVAQMPYTMLPAFITLGVILGAVGVFFNRALIWSLNTVRHFGMRTSFYIFPALVGLTVGVLMIGLPEATKGGEELAVRLTSEGLPLAIIALIVLLRFVMVMASYSTGVAGGIFAPILALATTIGLTFGTVLSFLVDLPALSLAAFAIAGMAGLFASTIGAPLVGMVLVMELTGAYPVLVPVMVTGIFSYMVAQALGGRPIYEVLLERTLAIDSENTINEKRAKEAASGQV